MLKWLDTGEVDQFVDGIVGDLVRRFPPSETDAMPKKETQRLMKARQTIIDQAARFGRERKLNLYKKARLGNRFKWALREAGYAPTFVDAFTRELVTVTTLAHKGK